MIEGSFRRRCGGPLNVTGCIVARNEALVIEGCITSLRHAVDEIVVVDHGSSDDTARIAQAAGARVIRSESPHHELTRNAYLEEVRTPWAMVLDADERLSDAGRAALPSLTQGAPPGVLGFGLERFDYIGGGRWAETRIVRLFRADANVRYFASRAHASVVPAIERCGGSVALADAPIHHLDALLARDHAAKRAHMRARLEAEIKGGGMAVMRCFLALELFAAGEEAEASAQLARAIEQNAQCAPIARLFLAQQYRARGRLHEAATVAQQVLDDTPTFRGRVNAWVTLADARDRLGDVHGATAAIEQALVESPTSAALQLDLATLLADSDRESDRVRARAHFTLALQKNPWMVSEAVFEAGAPSCVFRQQDSLLARTPRADVLAATLLP